MTPACRAGCVLEPGMNRKSTLTWQGLPVLRGVAIAIAFTLFLAACEKQKPQEEARPVRVIIVQRDAQGEPVSLTGQIRSAVQANLSFRLSGRLLERPVNVGDQVHVGQVIGKLDPQNQQNALVSAQAAVAAANGQLIEARSDFGRQKMLIGAGATSRAQYDQAQQAYQTALAQVSATGAQLKAAQDQLSYDVLLADSDGVVVAKGAEPGEVVQAWQMIAQVANRRGVDAVFDVPAVLIRTAPHDPNVEVVLADDSSVRTIGHVREVAPQADPTTRTFEVKVGLVDPPAAMRLGSTVTGRIHLSPVPGIDVPASSLTEAHGRPAVCVVTRA